MVISLAPTESSREAIVDNIMGQVNIILEFAQELDEYIGQKIPEINDADIGSLAVALETVESEVESSLLLIDNMRQLIQTTIDSRQGE